MAEEIEEVTPDMLLAAYAQGYFPMGRHRHDARLMWFNPDHRGILPLDALHIPRSLAKFLRHSPFEVRFNSDFATTITACADAPRGREDTWISERIIGLYTELHRMGHALSAETWHEGRLVGGVYGVTIGGAFFGESMFSLASNASKVALVALVERLRACGYRLFDTQYTNAHIRQFGVVTMPRTDYLLLLTQALKVSPNPSIRFFTASPITS